MSKIEHCIGPFVDLTLIEEYLKSIKAEVKNGIVFLTPLQHQMIHKLESENLKSKENYDRTNCCDAKFIENSDICSKCGEHADILIDEDEE